MEKKLDSAQRKFNPQFNADNQAPNVNQFSMDLEKDAELVIKRSKTQTARRKSTRSNAPKTPSTMERTGYNKSLESGNNGDGDDAFTPEQFKATASMTGMTTDEQGNRLSILPGSSRPSKGKASAAGASDEKKIASFASATDVEETKQPKTMLEKLKDEQAAFKPKEGKEPQQRKNFVRMNTNTNYKPRIRGAAFTSKIMAKKSNSIKAKQRWAQKKKIEDLKNRDQVTMYGGLGKVGLDYQGKKGQENLLDENVDGDNAPDEYQVPAFSG